MKRRFARLSDVNRWADGIHARLDILTRRSSEHDARFQSHNTRFQQLEDRLTLLETTTTEDHT